MPRCPIENLAAGAIEHRCFGIVSKGMTDKKSDDLDTQRAYMTQPPGVLPKAHLTRSGPSRQAYGQAPRRSTKTRGRLAGFAAAATPERPDSD